MPPDLAIANASSFSVTVSIAALRIPHPLSAIFLVTKDKALYLLCEIQNINRTLHLEDENQLVCPPELLHQK